MRWSLPFAEICLCQRVVAPVFLNAKTCPRRDNKDGDLWFVDDPQLLIMRNNWKRDILDDLLDRTTHCVCIDDLGMENGGIPDANIQASSEWSSGWAATKGRLNDPSSWYAAESQIGPIWIQADIGYQTYVSGVKTQGDEDTTVYYADWVTSFNVSTFVTTGANEVFVTDQNGNAITFWPGNVDSSTEVTTTFSDPVYARIVRIYCLTISRDYYALRFEIIGCKKD
ncbi:neuropilin-1a-like [Amphiura filiformis]|uniref:neuropilin-1a-like n=1 Tax=Amphiura filiformis TaxID=82378 RepID=UPI003B219FE0